MLSVQAPVVVPIDQRQQQQVIEQTRHYLQRAETLMGRSFDPIPVRFDLKGRAAGMYKVTRRERVIRYNPYIFSRYFDDNLADTVPHEVAHYVVDVVYGRRRIRPHGPEWRALMVQFGLQPRRTANYDLTGMPVRRHRQFPYRCACGPVSLGARRHRSFEQGVARYHCRRCGEVLRPEPLENA